MVTDVLEGLPPALKSRAEGATEIALVRDVVPRIREEDDGAYTVVLTFVRADPPAGTETWPVDELWELRRIAREIVPGAVTRTVASEAQKAGTTVDALPAFRWTVEFQPEHMPPLAEADELIAF